MNISNRTKEELTVHLSSYFFASLFILAVFMEAGCSQPIGWELPGIYGMQTLSLGSAT
jgi:hypothetical protein